MTTAPITTAVAPETTSHHQDVLNAFVDMSHVLALLVVDEAKAKTLPAAKAAFAFDRLARTLRRCVWFVHKLAEPIKTIDRVAARKQIIREVEDNIQRQADDPDQADDLREELMDRLDSQDLEDDIAGRTVNQIITDIVRDLGLAHSPGNHPWKRRTPADLAELLALATQPVPGGDRTPVFPRGSKGRSEPRRQRPSAGPLECEPSERPLAFLPTHRR
jgi:hypothetical protein